MGRSPTTLAVTSTVSSMLKAPHIYLHPDFSHKPDTHLASHSAPLPSPRGDADSAQPGPESAQCSSCPTQGRGATQAPELNKKPPWSGLHAHHARAGAAPGQRPGTHGYPALRGGTAAACRRPVASSDPTAPGDFITMGTGRTPMSPVGPVCTGGQTTRFGGGSELGRRMAAASSCSSPGPSLAGKIRAFSRLCHQLSQLVPSPIAPLICQDRHTQKRQGHQPVRSAHSL